MITTEKIEEWLRELEERPSSAPIILQFIANRLRDLSERNEELLAEIIQLRLDKKVEEYERRIENLEYQIDLLKRQLGGGVGIELPLPEAQVETEVVSLLLYNGLGQIFRIPLNKEDLQARRVPAALEYGKSYDPIVRLQAVSPNEELLFVFDTGRTETMPVRELPAVEDERLDWERAYLQDPRRDEELTAVIPIGRMSLFDYCLQISRRGCVKKIREGFLETYIRDGYIGTGVKAKTDQTFELIFTGSEDKLVLASREGFVAIQPVERLPLSIEEIFRLGPVDHVAAAFATGGKDYFLVITQNGKVIHRELSWLETPGALKTRGQPVFSRERREAGVRVVSAAAVGEQDWGAALDSTGRLSVFPINELIAAGAVNTSGAEVAGFTTFIYQADGNRKD